MPHICTSLICSGQVCSQQHASERLYQQAELQREERERRKHLIDSSRGSDAFKVPAGRLFVTTSIVTFDTAYYQQDI